MPSTCHCHCVIFVVAGLLHGWLLRHSSSSRSSSAHESNTRKIACCAHWGPQLHIVPCLGLHASCSRRELLPPYLPLCSLFILGDKLACLLRLVVLQALLVLVVLGLMLVLKRVVLPLLMLMLLLLLVVLEGLCWCCCCGCCCGGEVQAACGLKLPDAFGEAEAQTSGVT